MGEVLVLVENLSAGIAAVEHVIAVTSGRRSRRARHDESPRSQENHFRTPFGSYVCSFHPAESLRGGHQPTCTQSERAATSSGRFSCRPSMVARPHGVKPRISVPSSLQEK